MSTPEQASEKRALNDAILAAINAERAAGKLRASRRKAALLTRTLRVLVSLPGYILSRIFHP